MLLLKWLKGEKSNRSSYDRLCAFANSTAYVENELIAILATNVACKTTEEHCFSFYLPFHFELCLFYPLLIKIWENWFIWKVLVMILSRVMVFRCHSYTSCPKIFIFFNLYLWPVVYIVLIQLCFKLYLQVTSCKLWRQVGESFKPPK